MSRYERFIEKMKREGKVKYFDSKEDIEMMEEMNEISKEIKIESDTKQRNSEIAAKDIYLD